MRSQSSKLKMEFKIRNQNYESKFEFKIFTHAAINFELKFVITTSCLTSSYWVLMHMMYLCTESTVLSLKDLHLFFVFATAISNPHFELRKSDNGFVISDPENLWVYIFTNIMVLFSVFATAVLNPRFWIINIW